MSIASAQYDDDEILAMTRAAAVLVARWGVQDEAAERLLNGEGRAAALLGIHYALRCIYADSNRAARWIGAPNEAFDGASALDLMLADGLAGMRRVKAYLDAEIAS
ncbi:MbcA/ParS/Xre antitoxin family protein [Novosphingobium olei]|uniref:MbcA/ParS/Xre antitoxin family protein n=1 Tax=Novosphingobium olei TaxID=2728851 RepID=UPI00309350E7|nr:MbcA/ParS/Xre antitoxin family protein [Novosphingobium olei]